METLLLIALAVVLIPSFLWAFRSAEASTREVQQRIYEAELEERLQSERRAAWWRRRFSRGTASSSSNPRQGTVYVIQDLGTGLYKIGRTTNMKRRMRELGVGRSARLVTSKQVRDANAVERAAHQRYRAYRLPQTEYFKLKTPPVI